METAQQQLETRNSTQLAEAYIPLARKMAKEMYRALGRRFDLEELESDAYLGLCEAANSFVASHGVSFGFWAARRIRGAMIDELRKRSPDRIPDGIDDLYPEERIDHREKSPPEAAGLREEAAALAAGIAPKRLGLPRDEEFSGKAIARKLGTTRAGAYRRVRRARKILDEINADKVAKMKEKASCN